MNQESIDESKKSIANPIKINVSAVLKKKVKHQEKNEEEKVQDKSYFFIVFYLNYFIFQETINLICRQGNKIFAKEISLSNENKIVSILKKKEELEAVFLNYFITHYFFLNFLFFLN